MTLVFCKYFGDQWFAQQILKPWLAWSGYFHLSNWPFHHKFDFKGNLSKTHLRAFKLPSDNWLFRNTINLLLDVLKVKLENLPKDLHQSAGCHRLSCRKKHEPFQTVLVVMPCTLWELPIRSHSSGYHPYLMIGPNIISSLYVQQLSIWTSE